MHPIFGSEQQRLGESRAGQVQKSSRAIASGPERLAGIRGEQVSVSWKNTCIEGHGRGRCPKQDREEAVKGTSAHRPREGLSQ